MKQELLSVKNIEKTFENKGTQNKVLNDVSLTINDGEFLTIMGPSGSGKSTLLYSISGMDNINGGEVKFNNVDISSLDDKSIAKIRKEKMGFIFQHPTMLKDLNILDNICIPAIGVKKEIDSIKDKALELMKQTGISGLENRSINEVSGGELQRASICRALINNPLILFGDEPTGALNSKTTDEIINLLSDINQKGTTIMIVTHDPKVALVSSRVLFMKDGQLVSELNLSNLEVGDRRNALLNKMEELGI